jgi:hypothetical protein
MSKPNSDNREVREEVGVTSTRIRLIATVCEKKIVSDEAIHTSLQLWIASRSLSSGAHSRDPLARNDGQRD